MAEDITHLLNQCPYLIDLVDMDCNAGCREVMTQERADLICKTSNYLTCPAYLRSQPKCTEVVLYDFSHDIKMGGFQ